MRVVTFVEEHFEISVEDHDLVAENFGTIDALDRYVGSRTALV
jgi:acyl carrier protein